MAEKNARTEPFQSGQQTNARGKSQSTKIKSNMSKVRNIGLPDQLTQTLSGRRSYLPSDTHSFSHSKTPKARGTHYTPAGEFGGIVGRFKTKATNPMGGSGGKGTFRKNP